MANNRLFIVDTETNERFLLATSFGDGWRCFEGEYYTEASLERGEKLSRRLKSLDDWIFQRDGEVSYGDVTDVINKKTRLKLVTENELEFPKEAA